MKVVGTLTKREREALYDARCALDATGVIADAAMRAAADAIREERTIWETAAKRLDLSLDGRHRVNLLTGEIQRDDD